MTLAPLSERELHEARARAAAARRRRAELKAQVRRGERSLAEVLELSEHDPVIAQTRVVDLLKCVPRVGEKKARLVMDRFDIADNRRLRGLGRHQLAGLKGEFGER